MFIVLLLAKELVMRGRTDAKRKGGAANHDLS
jgi:hypothetical protein